MLLDWFKRRPRQEEPDEEWWEAVSRLEHDTRQLRLEWEETYGKVRRALATLAKRQAREDEQEEPAARPEARYGGQMDPHTIGERLRQARARYGRS